jgi:hypothetical protein
MTQNVLRLILCRYYRLSWSSERGTRLPPSIACCDPWPGPLVIGSNLQSLRHICSFALFHFVIHDSHWVETPGRKGEREKLCGCMQTSKDPIYIMTLQTLPLLILHLWPVCMGGMERSMRWVGHIQEARASMVVLCTGSQNRFILWEVEESLGM